MLSVINEIINTVFPNEDNTLYGVRFEVLYTVLFETANKAHIEQLKNEIVQCEKIYAENTRLEKLSFENVTPDIVLKMYAGIAYTLAILKLETKSNFILAHYLDLIFTEFLNNNYLSKSSEEQFKFLISEALLDFNYASGNSENMSFRLHNIADSHH